jgi:pyruvate/2-oxoglutarate dehydrogenase complex dihydrolipoamide dehydrogenase (E3) component
MASEERHYDAVVLGSGSSGRTISLRLAKNSFSVALVENELVGGDCAYWWEGKKEMNFAQEQQYLETEQRQQQQQQ